MSDAAENALSCLEEAVDRVLNLVKGAAYGLRVAAKRIGDLTASASSSLPGHAARSADEMEALILALSDGEENLSEIASLALGEHLRAFLGAALTLPALPNLPETPAEVEKLAGVPGALKNAPFEFALTLQLAHTALRGGMLDRKALDALGGGDLELVFSGGKVKLYREGDRVALSEEQLAAMGKAVVEAARAIRLRLSAA